MGIFGECVCAGQRANVLVSGLACDSCNLWAEAVDLPLECEFTLWIGAVGPIAATARRIDATRFAARFAEPVDERIVDHFAWAKG